MTTGKRLLSKIRPYNKLISGLAHPYRLAIIYLLVQKKPIAEKDIARRLSIQQSLAAHHVKLLYKTGWIRKKRTGRFVHFMIQEKAYKAFVRIFDGKLV